MTPELRQCRKRIKRLWLDVPRAALVANKSDAVLVLRLGAFANAVQACVLRIMASFRDRDSPATERDRMAMFLAAAGYLKEAIDHVHNNRSRFRDFLTAARDQGYPIEGRWDELEQVLTAVPGSVYDRIVKRVRHELAFHFKQRVFADWLDDGADETVRLWAVAGTLNSGRFYRASSDALANSLAEGRDAHDEQVRLDFGDVRDAQLALLPFAEACMLGFLIRAGLDPRDHFHVEYWTWRTRLWQFAGDVNRLRVRVRQWFSMRRSRS